MTFAELMQMRKATEQLKDCVEPAGVPFTQAPPEAHVWGLKAGLSPEYLEEHCGFLWVEASQKVACPILFNGEKSGAWHYRDVHGRKPKWIASKNASGCYWHAHGHFNITVIVEDLVSAIKLSKVGYSVVACMGTTITAKLIQLCTNDPVLVAWFDPDEAGSKAYRKLRKSSASLLTQISRVKSEKDPKEHSIEEILMYINGATDD